MNRAAAVSPRPSPAGPVDPALEDRWVEAARAGDEAAFEALVRAYQHRLYRTALRMMDDAGLAEDVVQDAFVQAWRHLPGFRSQARFSTWMTRIVINRCLNVQRSGRPIPLPPEGASRLAAALPTAAAAETIALAKLRRDAVRRAVLDLPVNQRAPLVLTTFADYTYIEAARILGISETAAKVRAHRARRALADTLREWR